METIEYEVVWAGRGSLPNASSEGWTQRGSYLLQAGDANHAGEGLPSSREMRGKGTAFDTRLWRGYRARTHMCPCGKGVPDKIWEEGGYECTWCRNKRARIEAAVEAVASPRS